MYKLVSESKGAFESMDHKFPRGCYNIEGGPEYEWLDGYNPYVEEVREYFSNLEKPKFLDLGCASGVLVRDALLHGFDAVGIEGTDHPIQSGREEWGKHYNKRLFLCDISEPFQILEDDKPAEFHIINAWEVMEHLYPRKLKTFADNVHKHLTDDGIFVFSVSPFKTRAKPNLHMSYMFKDMKKWEEILHQFKFVGPIKEKHNVAHHYLFKHRYRGRIKGKRKTYWSTTMKR